MITLLPNKSGETDVQSSGVCVGMGGWDLFPFDEGFYPVERGKGFRKLEFYSRFFDFVEVNSTFYNSAIPAAQVSRWLRDVSSNPRFIFTVKLFKGFSHFHRYTERDVASIRTLLDLLAADGRLGGLLMQFPYSFENTQANRQHLHNVGVLFNDHTRFVELRHDSWNLEAVVKFLQENQLHPVNVDLPRIKRHMPLTRHSSGDAAYVRLMGRNAANWDNPWRMEDDGKHMVSDRYFYDYSARELEEVVALIRSLDPGAFRTFVVFHNDPNANSLVNGFQLRRMMNPASPLGAPSTLISRNPRLERSRIESIGEEPAPTSVFSP